MTQRYISGILDELSLEDEFEKQLKKLFKKSLKKMLTNEFESGNINKLSQDGKNHENFIVWKFSQIN